MNQRTTVSAVAAATALVLTALAPPAGAQQGPSTAGRDRSGGFHTSAASMLSGANGTTTEPIITVGDQVRGYEFASLPDGISLLPGSRGHRGHRGQSRRSVEIVLNHETSKVPFPASRADSTNAILSRIRLDARDAGVLGGTYAIPSSAGYQRFCSNFYAARKEGFRRPTVFTVEEARDLVKRQEDSWEPDLAVNDPGVEQAGVVVAYDVESGRYRTIYGMGRHNHENAVTMRGYGRPVILSGDDTFDAPGSQLYMYLAGNGRQVWRDKGRLWAFKSEVASVNDYGDLDNGDRVGGKFIRVPKRIATGLNRDGSEVQSADFGYDAPPSASIPDGPQWVLEQWSNANNAFQFIRIEDLAPDRNNDRVLYFADTGEPRAIPDPDSTRLKRGPSGTLGAFMNGRIFKLELGRNPTRKATLSVLADFDDGGYDNAEEIHQPDNVETTRRAIYVTEDPGSHNKGASNARVWRIDLRTGERLLVAEVDQSSAPAELGLTPGDWETAGIVDVSSVFGPGYFLINVQAHGWDEQVGDPAFPGGPTPYREQGQLLLMHVPRH